MKNTRKNRIEGLQAPNEKQGSKKKLKEGQVSRFISEGNPNIQDTAIKEVERDEQGAQNIEQQDDFS